MGSTDAVATSHHLLPPFPDDLITAPLVSISLAKLEANDAEESTAFFNACKELGFFYMELSESNAGRQMILEAEQLNTLSHQFFERPQGEKDEYAREKIDAFFGYRKVALPQADRDAAPKLIETYNLRKDDFLGVRTPLPCHALIKEHWSLFISYVEHCRAAIDTLIRHLEQHLQLSPGDLAHIHRANEQSGDHIRFNRASVQPYSELVAKAGEHTDFGSLTILLNWLGGLQIQSPDTEQWVYVKPISGSAIVNLGDALVKFTAGLLRSNIHRVVPPPPPQDTIVRHSLVYFARPEDKIILKRLKGGIIDEVPMTDCERDEPDITAAEWILRRSVGDLKGVYTAKKGLESRA